MGCDPTDLGGVEVIITRHSKVLFKDLDDGESNAQLSASHDTIPTATKIDYKLFSKRGLTHGTG